MSLEPSAPDDSPKVVLERHVGQQRVATPFTLKKSFAFEFIVPEGGLRPGDRFSVTIDPPAWQRHEATSITVRIGDESIDLGEARLTLSGRHKGPVSLPPRGPNSACDEYFEADIVRATVELPPRLEPYRDYLLYHFLVDGELYEPAPSGRCGLRNRPPLGRGRRGAPGTEVLFSTCDGSEGLTPGTHTVAVRISTPDDRKLTTPTQTFEVDCATSPAPAPPPPEARPPEPPAADAPAIVPGPPPIDRGCSLVPRGPPLLVLPLLLRRRRPPSGPHPLAQRA
ncbi:hypothetical protein [Nannocystis punicea]|uniref:Uncharacterized protein n=1 Tax=Nannocystis punicea TaxID=2995304 RepID=A0ABY7H6K8_9BACT|nr:hypothetical protein [Nannocystis poenicansa]WAS94918.1 hypothetical protein O0S08_02045 [Nannocystis poenicansa]